MNVDGLIEYLQLVKRHYGNIPIEVKKSNYTKKKIDIIVKEGKVIIY